MADKEVIELGERLNRLDSSYDFVPLVDYMQNRISYLTEQIESQASTTNCNPAIVSHLAQRIDELRSISDWMDNAIQDGGKEKIKAQKEDIEREESATSSI